MNEKRITMKAEQKANDILACYGTKEGYNLCDVYAIDLFKALKKFYTENENTVGHTITHNNGMLYIDGEAVERFAISPDTLNRRIGRATGNYYDAEYRILKRQEEYMI